MFNGACESKVFMKKSRELTVKISLVFSRHLLKARNKLYNIYFSIKGHTFPIRSLISLKFTARQWCRVLMHSATDKMNVCWAQALWSIFFIWTSSIQYTSKTFKWSPVVFVYKIPCVQSLLRATHTPHHHRNHLRERKITFHL